MNICKLWTKKFDKTATRCVMASETANSDGMRNLGKDNPQTSKYIFYISHIYTYISMDERLFIKLNLHWLNLLTTSYMTAMLATVLALTLANWISWQQKELIL